MMAAMQSVAPGIDPLGVHDVSEIERAITALARGANGRLIVTLNGFTSGIAP